MRLRLPIIPRRSPCWRCPPRSKTTIGISAGLTGYAATVDRAWRDGVEVAVATINAKGGVMGRKLAVVTEDTAPSRRRRCRLSQDDQLGQRQRLHQRLRLGRQPPPRPSSRGRKSMVLCSILPQQPDQVKWAFSTLPPAGMEVRSGSIS
jgi:branched-chain amino acid transport system substrate-binding protein